MSIPVYAKRFPHSKNGCWRMAAVHQRTDCISGLGVKMIVVVVVVVAAAAAVVVVVVVAVAADPSLAGTEDVLVVEENH